MSTISDGLDDLHIVCEPRDVVANIIAIHGYNGDWKSTWTSSSAPVFFWLKDGLVVDLPHHRVLSFAYDPTVSKIEAASSRLLWALDVKFQSRESRSLPIIFIAEGLGGIVAKLAILKSPVSERYQFVGSNTRATCFFGTPHHGLSKAKTLQLSVTSKDSVLVDSINEQFSHFVPHQRLISFYETRPTQPSNSVVLDKA
ncbi:hypothetical protein BU26DRAFT_604358, partial [Trematosphaeria pertusa]